MVEPPVGEFWSERLGLGDRELISFVGAGGKTTLMLGLGSELVGQGRKVVITTTTKMGPDQIAPPVVESISAVEANLDRRPGPIFLVRRESESKVTGPPPNEVNKLFRESSADYVLVEADGARGRSLKAPSGFEPVIPSSSTIVVLVAGIDAVGSPITTACHRPERVAELLDRPVSHTLDVEDMAKILTSARGGLKDIPATARVAVALTKVASADIETARRLTRLVGNDPDVERVLVVPHQSPES